MWYEEDNQLVRHFSFRDFKEAFRFMTKVAELAEELDHHPWWSNVYSDLTIKLSTHSAGNRVTDKDRNMAEKIDLILEQFRDQ